MRLIQDNEDSQPFKVYNSDSESPYIITVEHSSNAVPKSMANLGLDESLLCNHIAYDPFVKEFSLDIANALNCCVITAEYSRLVIDCNRMVNSPQLVRSKSDGIIIPGNQNLSNTNVKNRIEQIYNPYHKAIDSIQYKYEKRNKSYAFISMHSFTPKLSTESKVRPWDIGFMWDIDDTLALKMYTFFKSNYPDIRIGLNVPYDARIEEKGSMHLHAWGKDVEAVEVELNQKTMSNPTKYKQILAAFVAFIKKEDYANNEERKYKQKRDASFSFFSKRSISNFQ